MPYSAIQSGMTFSLLLALSLVAAAGAPTVDGTTLGILEGQADVGSSRAPFAPSFTRKRGRERAPGQGTYLPLATLGRRFGRTQNRPARMLSRSSGESCQELKRIVTTDENLSVEWLECRAPLSA